MENDEFIIFLLNEHEEGIYEIKHTIAKALNQLVLNVTENQINKIKSLICKNTNRKFIEWIVKSVGCEAIQKISLEVLIDNKFIPLNEFDSIFIEYLTETRKITLITPIKTLCDELLFQFCKISKFRKPTLQSDALEYLIPQLLYRDEYTTFCSLKIISSLCVKREFIIQIVNNYKIYKPTIQCFSNCKLKNDKLLINVLKIMSIFSEFNEFREELLNNSNAFQLLLNLIEFKSNCNGNLFEIYLIEILKSFINSGRLFNLFYYYYYYSYNKNLIYFKLSFNSFKILIIKLDEILFLKNNN
jgi:hypothetical protein